MSAHPATTIADREKLRRKIERAVARLIDALDAIDGDADAEPCLGANEDHPGGWGRIDKVDRRASQHTWAASGDTDEREEACEDEGACIQSMPHDAEPNEPSLGATAAIDQTEWSTLGSPEDWELDPLDNVNLHSALYPTRDARLAARAGVQQMLASRRGAPPTPTTGSSDCVLVWPLVG